MRDLDRAILGAIATLGANAYGVTIRQEVSERIGRHMSIGRIYLTLEHLEEQGLVTHRTGESTPERGNRAKHYYTLTDAGHAARRAAPTGPQGAEA